MRSIALMMALESFTTHAWHERSKLREGKAEN
jgi:hypothetical protein